MSEVYEDITVGDYKSRFKDDDTPHLLLDVRTVEEFEEVRIPGAVNIPLDELSERISDVTASAGDNPIVVVCRSGMRSIMGAQILRYGGLKDQEILNLDTGTVGWVKQKLPTEDGPA